MTLLYALLGLLVGGGLNVLADDLPHKDRIQSPRCTHCDAPRPRTAWLTTVGILSGAGRCVHCNTRWPIRGLLVELTMALIFGLLAYARGLTGHTLLLSAYMAILVLVTVIDLEHRLVLNRVTLPAILLALAAGWVTPNLTFAQALVGGLMAFGVFYLVALLYPGGMGGGDVKLAAFIGLITGFPAVLVALIVAIFTGGIISLLLIVTRIRSRRDYIPYGPFMVIGGAFALFWGQPIMEGYLEEWDHGQSRAAIIVERTQRDAGWSAAGARQLDLVEELVELLKGDRGECLGAGDAKAVRQQRDFGGDFGIGRFENVQKVIGTQQRITGDPFDSRKSFF